MRSTLPLAVMRIMHVFRNRVKALQSEDGGRVVPSEMLPVKSRLGDSLPVECWCSTVGESVVVFAAAAAVARAAAAPGPTGRRGRCRCARGWRRAAAVSAVPMIVIIVVVVVVVVAART